MQDRRYRTIVLSTECYTGLTPLYEKMNYLENIDGALVIVHTSTACEAIRISTRFGGPFY